MIDKRTGKDVLRRPDPGERSYPDTGGLGVFAYSDYLAGNPYQANWQLESQSGPTELLLTGTYANGLKARRTIRLRKDEPVVHTETTLENAGASSLDVVLQSNCSSTREAWTGRPLLPPAGRKTVEQKLIQPGQEPRGSHGF